MPLTGDHLGAEVARGPDEGGEDGILRQVVLRKAEVCQTDVPVIVEQTILWLQITVKDLLRVQIFETKQNLAKVEHGVRFLEAAPLEHVEEKLTAATEIQHQEEVRARLEGPMHRNNEGMAQACEDPFLGDHALESLLLLEKAGLANDLHGPHQADGPVKRLDDLPRAAHAQDPDDLEVLYSVPTAAAGSTATRRPGHDFKNGLERTAVGECVLDGQIVVHDECSIPGHRRQGREHGHTTLSLGYRLPLLRGQPLPRAQRAASRRCHGRAGRAQQAAGLLLLLRAEHLQADEFWGLGPIGVQLLHDPAQQPTGRRAGLHIEHEVLLLLDPDIPLEARDNAGVGQRPVLACRGLGSRCGLCRRGGVGASIRAHAGRSGGAACRTDRRKTERE
mmetsp:Transcript_82747/g.210525  ORF Transcript_82747/g.210525 Transcript_82747/m.210525 type:complete len:391 (-) Transcript_82747:55-1227(-)